MKSPFLTQVDDHMSSLEGIVIIIPKCILCIDINTFVQLAKDTKMKR